MQILINCTTVVALVKLRKLGFKAGGRRMALPSGRQLAPSIETTAS